MVRKRWQTPEPLSNEERQLEDPDKQIKSNRRHAHRSIAAKREQASEPSFPVTCGHLTRKLCRQRGHYKHAIKSATVLVAMEHVDAAIVRRYNLRCAPAWSLHRLLHTELNQVSTT